MSSAKVKSSSTRKLCAGGRDLKNVTKMRALTAAGDRAVTVLTKVLGGAQPTGREPHRPDYRGLRVP